MESKLPSPSVIAVVSCPDIGPESPLLGIVGGSCGGWGMLLDKARIEPYSTREYACLHLSTLFLRDE